MSLPQLQAFMDGYGDRMLDQQVLAILQGYWSGYYNGNNKRAKPVKDNIKKLTDNHAKEDKKRKQADQRTQVPRPDVDVERFLEMERKFKMNRGESSG